jgi:dUTPase
MSFNKEHVLFISNVPQISMLNGLYTIPKFIRSSTTENLLITMENTTSQRVNIKKGQKIAEGILIPIPFTQIEVVKELT